MWLRQYNCCTDLRVGAIAVAIFQIFTGMSILCLLVYCETLDIRDTKIANVRRTTGIINFILSVTSGSSLLYGAIKYNAPATLANLVISIISILLATLSAIIMLLLAFDSEYDILFAFMYAEVALIQVILWICVHSFFRDLKTGYTRSDQIPPDIPDK